MLAISVSLSMSLPAGWFAIWSGLGLPGAKGIIWSLGAPLDAQ
jgi:hypothetical protein